MSIIMVYYDLIFNKSIRGEGWLETVSYFAMRCILLPPFEVFWKDFTTWSFLFPPICVQFQVRVNIYLYAFKKFKFWFIRS